MEAGTAHDGGTQEELSTQVGRGVNCGVRTVASEPSSGVSARPSSPRFREPRLRRTSLKQQGFALVLALLMMAFVLVLLLSMTLLLQVETTNSSRALAQLRAKESARLALMMALGDLQRYAGPDQRVTARAEILGGDLEDQNPYWTGVWDTANPTAPPRWMTSWQDQSAPFPSQSIELVGSGSIASDPSQHVTAPIIQVQEPDGGSNEIAWWVSDEASKVSLGTVPLNARDEFNFLDEHEVGALELQTASAHGLEELINGYERFTFGRLEDLGRINSISQGLGLLGSSTTEDIDGESAFHVFATASYGVLANVLPASDSDSGLMQDLSLFPSLLGGGIKEFLNYGDAHSKIQNESGDSIQKLKLYTEIQGLEAIGSLANGDIATPIAPVLTNLMIAFTIRSPSASDPNLFLRMRFFCELWNPFTHSLMMIDSDGNEMAFEIEISGLPTDILVENVISKATSDEINLQSLLGDPTRSNNPLVIRLKNGADSEWLPGQTKNWTGVDAGIGSTASPYNSIEVESKDWDAEKLTLGGSKGIDTGVPRVAATKIRHYSASYSPNSLSVTLNLVNNTDGSKQTILELPLIMYEPVETKPPQGSNNPDGFANAHKGSTFGYHIQLREPHHSINDADYFRGRWLFDHDPRNVSPNFVPDWYLENDQASSQGSAYIPVIDAHVAIGIPEPQLLNEAVSDSIGFVSFRRLIDRSNSGSFPITENHYNKLWQDTPLFELPRERVLSLASLQHLYIHNERPFQVGNSWGSNGTTNTLAWFDRYYFTGISRSDTADDFDAVEGAPNPTLVSYDMEDGSSEISNWQEQDPDDASTAREPATHFLVANRFNINSTSVAAWKAALGSLRINDYDYLDYPEEDTSDLSTLTVSNASKERMFARFSHSLLETYEAPETPAFEGSEPVAPSAFYRHGARRLTEQQVSDLAENIVSQITDRGEPFFSMEEFLSVASSTDTSLLERAIADVLAPNGRQKWFHNWELEGDETALSGTPIDIDHFSPGFLTQADMMTAFGPMLAPRSDTFMIRARSRSYTDFGELEGTAAVEAIVQRTPEATDTAVNELGSTERKFKLLSIRWLSEDEI